MKKFFSLSILLLIFYVSSAQYDSQFCLNMFNHMAINPGYAGSKDAVSLVLLGREQWMGFDGAPTTQVFSIHTPFKLFNAQHGAGLSLSNDKIGFETNLGIHLAYSYHKTVGQGNLGIGFNAGVINQSLSPDWKYPEQASDPAVPVGGDDKPMIFDLGLGAFYQTDNFYFGISSTHLNQPKIKYKEGIIDDKYSYISRHYYITAGYTYQLANPLFEFRPSVFIESDKTSSQYSVNGIVMYNKRFWGGVSYRLTDAAIAMFGVEFLSGLNIAIAYEMPATTKINYKYQSGSFEFVINYTFKVSVEKEKNIYKSIRFL
ncbi:MAG: type IX secretion system membrane protein PorP/SprF [Bacteroidetes bacterium]|nr:type IX secretion system membrane protein PorP/SprF [Bacteroidota bacterium]